MDMREKLFTKTMTNNLLSAHMKTVAELIKELSVLDQSKPIWIHYDMAYSQTPEISIADADTYDCDNRIKVGDYLL